MQNKKKMTIRMATPDDFKAILEMIQELALFEKAPEKVTNSIAQMEEEKDFFHCFVAENTDKEIMGMALYYFTYYTWVGKSLYLDDLYVKEKFRGQNIGSILLNKIFEVARKERCKRVRWQVLHWNAPALKLYEKSGATIDDEWCNCDFDKTKIQNFKL